MENIGKKVSLEKENKPKSLEEALNVIDNLKDHANKLGKSVKRIMHWAAVLAVLNVGVISYLEYASDKQKDLINQKLRNIENYFENEYQVPKNAFDFGVTGTMTQE